MATFVETGMAWTPAFGAHSCLTKPFVAHSCSTKPFVAHEADIHDHQASVLAIRAAWFDAEDCEALFRSSP